MQSFQRILIPTDFSLCAEAALQHGLYLAQRHEAQVHLLHVVTPSKIHARQPRAGNRAVVWPDPITAPRPGVPAYTEHWNHGRLLRVLRRHDDPAAAILNYARDEAIDCIVMGAHGDRGVGYFLSLGAGSAFLGQTAEQVIRHAACPVFRVAMRRGRTPVLVNRILVPVDGSSLSRLALAYARDLAALYDARLDLLHVLPRNGANHNGEPSASWAARMGQARAALQKAFSETEGPDRPVGFHVGVGSPAREIRAFAERHAVNLIVLGAYTDQGREALGDVAEQVVRTAPSPVLVVRRRERVRGNDDTVRRGNPFPAPDGEELASI